MQPVDNLDPTTFNSKKGEMITVRFAPNPPNALGAITYCFKQSCKKSDQKQVIGNQFSFTVNQDSILLQLFFFFIPGTEEEQNGECDILLTSSTGQTYKEPNPIEEDSTGLLPNAMYIFKAV